MFLKIFKWLVFMFNGIYISFFSVLSYLALGQFISNIYLKGLFSLILGLTMFFGLFFLEKIKHYTFSKNSKLGYGDWLLSIFIFGLNIFLIFSLINGVQPNPNKDTIAKTTEIVKEKVQEKTGE